MRVPRLLGLIPALFELIKDLGQICPGAFSDEPIVPVIDPLEGVRQNFPMRYLWLAIPLFSALLFFQYWTSHDDTIQRADFGEYMHAAQKIRGAGQIGGALNELHYLYFERIWKPVLIPALIAPFLHITGGDTISAATAYGVFFTLFWILGLFLLILRLSESAALAAATVSLIGVAPWMLADMVSTGCELPWITAAIWYLYFINQKRAWPAAGFLVLAHLCRPVESLAVLAPPWLYLCYRERNWRQVLFAAVAVTAWYAPHWTALVNWIKLCSVGDFVYSTPFLARTKENFVWLFMNQMGLLLFVPLLLQIIYFRPALEFWKSKRDLLVITLWGALALAMVGAQTNSRDFRYYQVSWILILLGSVVALPKRRWLVAAVFVCAIVQSYGLFFQFGGTFPVLGDYSALSSPDPDLDFKQVFATLESFNLPDKITFSVEEEEIVMVVTVVDPRKISVRAWERGHEWMDRTGWPDRIADVVIARAGAPLPERYANLKKMKLGEVDVHSPFTESTRQIYEYWRFNL